MDEANKDSSFQRIAKQQSKGMESVSQEISIINSEPADSNSNSDDDKLDQSEEYDVFDMQSSEDYLMGDESLSMPSSSEVQKTALKKEKSNS